MPPRPSGRAPRRPGGGSRPPTPPIVRRHRSAAPGGHTLCAVHPGALPAEVWSNLVEALPAQNGLVVLDLGGVPEYFEAALERGRPRLTVGSLVDRLLDAYRAERAAERGGFDGVVTLAGWSFGGVLAQAMTERLAPAERPGRLVLLDSIAPVDAYQQPDEALDAPLLLRWFAMYLGAKRNRAISPGPDWSAGCDTDTGLVRVLAAAVECGALPESTPLPGLRKLYDTYVEGLLRNNRLTAPHRPVPSSVPLVLVKAEGSLIPDDETLGWEQLAPHGLAVHTVPGDHYTMLTRRDSAAAIAALVHRP